MTRADLIAEIERLEELANKRLLRGHGRPAPQLQRSTSSPPTDVGEALLRTVNQAGPQRQVVDELQLALRDDRRRLRDLNIGVAAVDDLDNPVACSSVAGPGASTGALRRS